MKVILDASVVVDYLRTGRGVYPGMVEDGAEFVMSSVTAAELYSGKSAQEGGRQWNDLEVVVGGVEVIPPDLEAARLVGKLRGKYQLGLGDAFVAALALGEGLPVATLDKKAFGNIKKLEFYL